MDELRRNGSGYYDPTAYKAIKNIEREENEMEIKKGEVWEIEMGNSVRTAVVLATHGSYSIVLSFTDEPRERRTVQLNAQGMKYTEPGMISYKFHDNFVKFIRLTNDEEFADILKQVADALEIESNPPLEDIPFGIAESKEIRRLQEELAEAKAKNLELVNYNTNLLSENVDLQGKEKNRIKLETERDLYKSLYEQTIERLIG